MKDIKPSEAEVAEAHCSICMETLSVSTLESPRDFISCTLQLKTDW